MVVSPVWRKKIESGREIACIRTDNIERITKLNKQYYNDKMENTIWEKILKFIQIRKLERK